jgi:hypothetical protein
MRAFLLLLSAAVTLSACGDNQTAANETGTDASVGTAEFGSNDVTAIDAATNRAAEMAQDVEVTANLENAIDPGNATGELSNAAQNAAEDNST